MSSYNISYVKEVLMSHNEEDLIEYITMCNAIIANREYDSAIKNGASLKEAAEAAVNTSAGVMA